MCFFYEAKGASISPSGISISPHLEVHIDHVWRNPVLCGEADAMPVGVSYVAFFFGLLQYMFMGPRYDYVNKSICKL